MSDELRARSEARARADARRAPAPPAHAGAPHAELLESGDGPSRAAQWWSARTPRRRRATVAAVLLFVASAVLALLAQQLRVWLEERSLRDGIAIAAELGIDASSSAWSPAGPGRVDYVLLLRNEAPRPVRIEGVRFQPGRLHVRPRHRLRARVSPGELLHVPLSVELDCGRPAPRTGPVLSSRVTVVTASRRRAQVPTLVADAGPLIGAARVLCELDPELRLRELSGPVGRRPGPDT
jgi:hypothetical protein